MQSENEGYTEILVWGTDTCGQLGLGNENDRLCYCVPKVCTFNVVIRKVACGEEHSAFITNNGWIYTMGSNSNGKLGIGDKLMRNSSIPCLVETLSQYNAVDIACGFGHTVAIIDDGRAFAWGLGEYGALGTLGYESQWLPKQMVLGTESMKSVSCGTRHTAMIDNKGRLFVCGANDAGQLGIGTREKQLRLIHVSGIRNIIIKVACGIFHTLALTSLGSILAMGGNNFGQLGIGSRHSSSVPMNVKGLEGDTMIDISAGNISAAVSKEGKVYVWGTGVFGEYISPRLLTGIKVPIKAAQVRGNFGVAMSIDAEIYTWGSNDNGELGLGDYNARPQPCKLNSIKRNIVTSISCGGSYVIALGRNMLSKYSKPLNIESTERTFKKNREEDMLLKYDLEQQKVKESVKALPYNPQENLLNRLRSLQDQLDNEKRSNDSLVNEVKLIRDQGLQRIFEDLKEENRALREKGIGGSMKISEVLKEYENRIEKEIQEKREITREKNEEIRELHSTIAQIEDSISLLQKEKAKTAEYYTSELKSIEIKVEQTKQVLEVKIAERNELIELRNKDNENERLVKEDLDRTKEEVKSSEQYIRDLLSKLENEKRNYFSLQNDFQAASAKNKELISLIQEREFIYNKELTNLNETEEATIRDIDQFKSELNEKIKDNEDLKNSLNRRLSEYDNLTRDISTCTEEAKRIRMENTELKRYITELEEKNKSIANIKVREHNPRAKLPVRSRFVTPSPERFEASTEHEKASLPTTKYNRSIMSECKNSIKRSLNPKVREIIFNDKGVNIKRDEIETYTTPKKPEEYYKPEKRPLKNQVFLSTQKPIDRLSAIPNPIDSIGVGVRNKEAVTLVCDVYR